VAQAGVALSRRVELQRFAPAFQSAIADHVDGVDLRIVARHGCFGVGKPSFDQANLQVTDQDTAMRVHLKNGA
jgi:hypothetical protein